VKQKIESSKWLKQIIWQFLDTKLLGKSIGTMNNALSSAMTVPDDNSNAEVS